MYLARDFAELILPLLFVKCHGMSNIRRTDRNLVLCLKKNGVFPSHIICSAITNKKLVLKCNKQSNMLRIYI